MKPMDFKNYFAIPKAILYFQTPGNGLMPVTHLEWRQKRELKFFDSSSNLRDEQTAFLKTVKINFSDFFNCAFERTYLVPNFSFGFNTLLAGLNKSLTIALLADDYPSLNYPVISRGFNYTMIKVSTHLEDDIYQHIVDNKPDLLVLSIVNYITGIKVDLNFIQKLKRDFPDLLIVGDATQFLGTDFFDFDNSGFDAVAGSGYKWLLAGFGNGYMMLSEAMADVLYQSAKEIARPSEAMWSHKSVLDVYFEPGHQDTLSHGTLNQSIDFFRAIGMSAVKNYLDEIIHYAYSIFEKRNWLLPEVAGRAIRSTLINLQINPIWYARLLELGVKCFPRGTGIRIGLHIYTSKEDIDRLVEIIDKVEDEFKNR